MPADLPPGANRHRAWAPGRVNLIGDHTDYTGGLVLPMATDLGTLVEVEFSSEADELTFSSSHEPEPARFKLDGTPLGSKAPVWSAYLGAILAALRPPQGGHGRVTTTLPIGAGLASSAALELSLALALGFDGAGRDLALLAQAAEQAASGVPCGIMDQLACALGQVGHALAIDCHTLATTPVPVPKECEIIVVHSGTSRRLADTAYGERRQECQAIEELIGPLRQASYDALSAISDPRLKRRARHVVSENTRVGQAAAALGGSDLKAMGRLMTESHTSLSADFEVSTPELDHLVGWLNALPGVYGARLTGAGFGGCVVVLAQPGAVDLAAFKTLAWIVRPSSGARLLRWP
ncbi:MAG: galactokinase [Acidimicrobiales bacterium]